MVDIDDGSAANEGGEWKPLNLIDGPTRALNRAAVQVSAGGAFAALWGLALLGCVALRMNGFASVTSITWDLLAGVLLLLFSLGAPGRSRGAMAVVSLLVACDLPVQVLGLYGAKLHRISSGTNMAVARLVGLPFVLYVVTRGYRGAVDYRLMRDGARPRNWRMWAPMPFLGGFLAYTTAIVFVMLTWRGTLEHMFEQPGAKIRGKAPTVTPLMQAIYADLISIKVQPFAEADKDEGKSKSGPRVWLEALWKNKDGEGLVPSLASLPEPLRRVIAEATSFAGPADNVGCLSEALRRENACEDDECRLLAKVFMTSCLPASRPTKDFCAGVPATNAVVETAAWQSRVCGQGGDSPVGCRIFYESLQNYCHPEALG